MLLNLVLNARDAMPDGGDLDIETANSSLDRDRLATEALTLKPGRYVMLLVSDSGTGMDESTRARAFEPFFTTKPKGKGTGLGLATVYGIVDQSGGQIALDTAPGRGTTFRIYLPEANIDTDDVKPPRTDAREDGGTEVLLLVEDNDSVAICPPVRCGAGAIRFTKRRAARMPSSGGPIGIVTGFAVSDVVMPGISGPQLARQLTEFHPSMRVLFISGYTGAADESPGASLAGCLPSEAVFRRHAGRRVRIVLDTTRA